MRCFNIYSSFIFLFSLLLSIFLLLTLFDAFSLSEPALYLFGIVSTL